MDLSGETSNAAESTAAPDGEHLVLHQYAARAYLDYAISVVKARSLPEVADGLKPVQRRILFAMRELNLGPSAKPRKCAAVVGKVLGELHPHGDQSVYDALVRVAQDFSLRYPLIEGQGNFGSRDGDGAAAMRYTEARLTPIAELLLSELDLGTVDFIPNYDGQFEEPPILPARLPFVLLNGAKGPAVGYRPELPPHNLREVAAALCLLIRNPGAGLEEVLEALPGPDFPNGSQIISSPSVIAETYRNGRGSLRMRARWQKEDLARNQWRIVIKELPPGVSTQSVMVEIESAINPQVRAGKKALSQEQVNLKALMSSVIDKVRDESTDDSPVRLVLEPKSSKQSPEEFMAVMLAHTSLETSVPVDLVMLGLDGNPKQKDLVTILREWIEFRFTTVIRRIRHRLMEIAKRLHILRGRMTAFVHIEEVIRVIREADDPRASLMEKFGLTEIQADDILEIRLRQLARLEGIRIEAEINALTEESRLLQHQLDNRDALTNRILEEIESDARKYGDDRRTLIEEVAPVRAAEVAVPDEAVTVVLSRNGWIRSRQGVGHDPAAMIYKSGDGEFALVETRTTSLLFVLDNNGRVYSVKVSDIPGGRGDGVPIASLIDFQPGVNGAAKVAHVFSGALESRYLFAGSGGYGFIAELSKLVVARGKAGKAFMTIEAGETILKPAKAGPEAVVAICGAQKGARMLVFKSDEMKLLPGGKGVIIMGLAAGEVLAHVGFSGMDAVTLKTADGELTLADAELDKYKLSRARKGCLLPAKVVVHGIHQA